MIRNEEMNETQQTFKPFVQGSEEGPLTILKT